MLQKPLLVTGFSARNLWDMRRLIESYTNPGFLEKVARELDADSKNWRQPVAKLKEPDIMEKRGPLVLGTPLCYFANRRLFVK